MIKCMVVRYGLDGDLCAHIEQDGDDYEVLEIVPRMSGKTRPWIAKEAARRLRKLADQFDKVAEKEASKIAKGKK